MNAISISGSTTQAHEQTERLASAPAGHPSRRRARAAGAGRKALLVLSLTLALFAAAGVTAPEAKASMQRIGGFACSPVTGHWTVTYPRGTYGYGFFQVVTDGVQTYASPTLYWNGSYWQAHAAGQWYRVPSAVTYHSWNVNVAVYWYSYTYRTWFVMGGCSIMRAPGL